MKEDEGMIGDETPESVTLVIEFKSDGKINVNGPITNEMLSFFMLEKAKDIIKAHNIGLAIKERQSKIQPVHGGIMNFARRKF